LNPQRKERPAEVPGERAKAKADQQNDLLATGASDWRSNTRG
jgi:hypothetical protein